MNKRVAIGIAAAIAGLILVTTLGILFAGGDRRLGAVNRSYAAGSFFVEIEGLKVGAVKSVEGCGVGSDPVTEKPGTDGVRRKHLAGVKYEPCVLQASSGMDTAVYNWINAMLAGNQTEKDVVIVETDYDRKERRRIALQDALLTRVKFPDLDAASKDAAYIELELTPELTQRSAGTGATYSAGLTPKSNQKSWLPSNFRLTIPGVDSTKVSRISGFEAKQALSEAPVGEVRDYATEPAALELGNLVLTVPALNSADYNTWFTSFVVQGNSAQSNEKTATLDYLSPNRADVLLTLSFQGVGVFRMTEDSADAGKEGPSTRRYYSLYVETAALSGYGGSVGGAPVSSGGSGGTTTTTATTTTQTAVPVEATITPVAGQLLADGETFTISDGVNEPMTFEFDLDGTAEHNAVRFSKEDPKEAVAAAIVEAINGVAAKLGIVAQTTEIDVVQLRSERGAEAGEEKILEFVESDEFKVRDAEKEVEALPAPSELTAATGVAEGEVDLRWNPIEGALGYLVLFSTEPGSTEYIELDKSEGTELTVAGLKSGVEHFFVVRALDGTNVSKNSNEAAATAG